VAEQQLVVENLRKTYDLGLFKPRAEVLKGVSFSVGKGEVFGFLGPNGAGKTTTIKAITGIIDIDEGTIEIDGAPHVSLAAKRKLGFMPENPYFYGHLTVQEQLEFYSELVQLDRSSVKRRIGELLQLVGMAKHATKATRTLSKGMLQRISLAQAMLTQPELLILDEPMSGFDPIGRQEIRNLILSEKHAGRTIFLSSHIIPDVETICDRVAIIVNGTIRTIGSVKDTVTKGSERYEIVFTGVDAVQVTTQIESLNRGSESAWIVVEEHFKEAVISELITAGARIVSVAPQRDPLEELLLEHYAKEVE